MAAEVVGTFCLVLAAAGSVMGDDLTAGRIGPIGVAIAPGFAVMAMVYSIGSISGAHLNPAVTLAFTSARTMRWTTALGYVSAEITGAVFAAAVLRAILGGVADVGAHAPSVGTPQSLVMEFALTFILMFVIMAVVSNKAAVGSASGVAVGGTVALGVLIGSPVSGGSMNPARAFGPALFGWAWTDHWVYWVGTIIGGTTGAFAYMRLDSGSDLAASLSEHIAGRSSS